MVSLRCVDWMPPVNTSCMHAAAHFACVRRRGRSGITRTSASRAARASMLQPAAPSTGSAPSGQSAAGANAGAVSAACHARSNASAASILRQRLKAHIRSRAELPCGGLDDALRQSAMRRAGAWSTETRWQWRRGRTNSPLVKMDAGESPYQAAASCRSSHV